MKKIIYVVIFMMTMMVSVSCGNKTAKSTDADTATVDTVQTDSVDTTVVDSTVCLD